MTEKTFQNEIDATHPMEDPGVPLAFEADDLAMKLVGERHDKRDLVDLVRWLILRKPDGLIKAEVEPPVVRHRKVPKWGGDDE